MTINTSVVAHPMPRVLIGESEKGASRSAAAWWFKMGGDGRDLVALDLGGLRQLLDVDEAQSVIDALTEALDTRIAGLVCYRCGGPRGRRASEICSTCDDALLQAAQARDGAS